jgi:exosortase A
LHGRHVNLAIWQIGTITMSVGDAIRAAERHGNRSAGWTVHAVLTGLVLVVIGLLHHDTWSSIAYTWSKSGTYTHGWLILPFCAWLIWRQRSDLVAIQPRTCWSALVLVAILEFLWIGGAVAGVQGAQHFVVVALIPATMLLLLGPRVVWSLAFPLGYLVFAIPWGEALVPTLQDITAHMAVALLELSNVPVYWEGRLISIPVGDFVVAEACAGVRYLIAALALGTLFAYLVYRSIWRRLAFIAACAVVPIVANGVRAWGIIMLASLSNMRLAVGVDHLIYGWIFFGVVMFVLFWLGAWWREPEETTSSGLATAGASSMPRRSSEIFWKRSSVFAATAVAVLAFAASMTPGWLKQVQPVLETRIVLPEASSDWVTKSESADDWYRGFEGADDIRLKMYQASSESEPVGVLVIHYRHETQGAELVNSVNQLHSDGWKWLNSGDAAMRAGEQERVVRELALVRGDNHRLLWWWYDIGGWRTTSPVMAKAYAAVKRLSGQPGDATLVALGTEYGVEAEQARSRLRGFLESYPELSAPRAVVEVPRSNG